MRPYIVLCVSLTIGAAFGQTPDLKKHPPETQKLVDSARAVAEEFRADVLFRLLDTGRIVDPEWKRELLEELFSTASQAQYPVALYDAGSQTDTRSWALASGLALQLDALSIRCRVISHMLELDPQRARELLQQIVPPPIKDLHCEDVMLSNMSVLYDTAREAAASAHLLEPYVRMLTSSLQLPAAAKAIRMIPATGEDRQKLLNVFAQRLGEIADADRGFAFTMQRLDFANEIVRLAEESRKQGIPVEGLIAAYRTYLVRHLHGERCADTNSGDAVKMFNDRLRLAGYLISSDLSPITEDESSPISVAGKAKIQSYWRSPHSKRLLSEFKHLRFGNTAQNLATEQKESAEWQAEVRQFTSDLASWEPQDEPTSADYFHQRAILCNSLIAVIPNRDLRDGAIQSCVAFLSQTPISRESPVEFLPHLKAILQNGGSVLEAMRNSKDAVLMLYASLEK